LFVLCKQSPSLNKIEEDGNLKSTNNELENSILKKNAYQD